MKSVFISGASRGIGRAIALLFAKNGYRVFGCYSNSDNDAAQTEKLFAQLGLSISLYKADVSSREQIFSLFNKLGRLDVLVNNAGIACNKQIQDVSEELLSRCFAVNVFGGVYLTQAALQTMLSEKSGTIINISSIWGETGASCESVYSASKAAVIGFTRSLAKELAPSGIRVNCVSAGFIDTSMNDNLSEADKLAFIDEIPLGRAGTAQEIAEAVFYLANAEYVTGQILSVNGGLL